MDAACHRKKNTWRASSFGFREAKILVKDWILWKNVAYFRIPEKEFILWYNQNGQLLIMGFSISSNLLKGLSLYIYNISYIDIHIHRLHRLTNQRKNGEEFMKNVKKHLIQTNNRCWFESWWVSQLHTVHPRKSKLEQWKKGPWLFRVYRGYTLYYQVKLCGECFKNNYKDPYSPTVFHGKAGVFRGSNIYTNENTLKKDACLLPQA